MANTVSLTGSKTASETSHCARLWGVFSIELVIVERPTLILMALLSGLGSWTEWEWGEPEPHCSLPHDCRHSGSCHLWLLLTPPHHDWQPPPLEEWAKINPLPFLTFLFVCFVFWYSNKTNNKNNTVFQWKEISFKIYWHKNRCVFVFLFVCLLETNSYHVALVGLVF